MRDVDYNLLVSAERVRYQSAFSSAHWLHQVISSYERGIQNPKRREAFERVLLTAINAGVKSARELADTYPDIAGFPKYLRLSGGPQWKRTQKAILGDFDRHEHNRFHYLREGD